MAKKYNFLGKEVWYNPGQQYVRWVFTWNNYTDEIWEDLKSRVGEDKEFKYLLMSKEIGATAGTPHIQGYFELNVRMRPAQMVKLYPWVEPASKEVCKNMEYITKKPIEVFHAGEPGRAKMDKGSQKGGEQESDKWKEIAYLMKTGKREALAENYPRENIMYKLESRCQNPVLDKLAPSGLWLYGPKHTGKSEFAYKFGEKRGGYYEKMFNKWWPEYTGQPCVILNDPQPGQFRDVRDWLFPLMSSRPQLVEVKGGHVKVRPRYVIVTSNISIFKFMFGDRDESLTKEEDKACYDALRSRFTEIQFKNTWSLSSDRNPPVQFDKEEEMLVKRQRLDKKEEIAALDGEIAKTIFIQAMEKQIPHIEAGGDITDQNAPGKDESPSDDEEGVSERGREDEE